MVTKRRFRPCNGSKPLGRECAKIDHGLVNHELRSIGSAKRRVDTFKARGIISIEPSVMSVFREGGHTKVLQPVIELVAINMVRNASTGKLDAVHGEYYPVRRIAFPVQRCVYSGLSAIRLVPSAANDLSTPRGVPLFHPMLILEVGQRTFFPDEVSRGRIVGEEIVPVHSRKRTH